MRKEIKEAVNSVFSQMLGRDIRELPSYSKLVVERPREEEHGDYYTNACLMLSKDAGRDPLELAGLAVPRLAKALPLCEDIEAAPPGFINFRVSAAWTARELNRALRDLDGFGRPERRLCEKVQVEFVSVNPVGPLHIGGGRWAAIGNCIANLIALMGADVTREFYINDYGNQVRLFSQSVFSSYASLFGKSVEPPAGGYRGQYIAEYAEKIRQVYGDRFLASGASEEFQRACVDIALAEIKSSLDRLGVSFDVWFSERSLHESGKVDEILRLLKDKGLTYEKDGAVWLKSTSFGDDKDRVLVKSTGEKTYLCVDIAYHANKLERGFDRIIDIWGADHHGHVRRMYAAFAALGHDSSKLEILLGQLVNLTRDGIPVRMSKRAGEMITLDELLDEVGPDVAKYIFLTKTMDSPLDFDIEVVKRGSNQSPVFYIQYAHARIASIMRKANERGVELPDIRSYEFSEIPAEPELRLAKVLLAFPEHLEAAAEQRAPHLLASYVEKLAKSFHFFYRKCRVLTKNSEVAERRLVLTLLVKHVLAKALSIMGISAPESM